MNSRRMLSTIAAATIGAALLSGCAAEPAAGPAAEPGGAPGTEPLDSPSSVDYDSYPGHPHGGSAGLDDGVFTGEPIVQWVDRAATFSITVFDSSSCPASPASIETTAPHLVTVTLGSDPLAPCTDDLAPTTHELRVPSEASALPLTIVLEGDFVAEFVLD
ncbi:hypothetical protein [Marisediminicola sp. LYQ134]|uniref:hypothetical protein n=1 Tax=Marisediminicola sp. LYQ134 TaxID=3391061 RepID=UPI0039830988